MSATTLRVRYAETDQMGVAHHSSYVLWFEVARTEFMRQRGIAYRDLEDGGLMLPVIELHCHFHTPCRYDDEVAVATSMEMKGPLLTFRYEVRRAGDDRLVAEGKTVHAWADRRGRPVNPRHHRDGLLRWLFDAAGPGGGTD